MLASERQREMFVSERQRKMSVSERQRELAVSERQREMCASERQRECENMRPRCFLYHPSGHYVRFIMRVEHVYPQPLWLK